MNFAMTVKAKCLFITFGPKQQEISGSRYMFVCKNICKIKRVHCIVFDFQAEHISFVHSGFDIEV